MAADFLSNLSDALGRFFDDTARTFRILKKSDDLLDELSGQERSSGESEDDESGDDNGDD